MEPAYQKMDAHSWSVMGKSLVDTGYVLKQTHDTPADGRFIVPFFGRSSSWDELPELYDALEVITLAPTERTMAVFRNRVCGRACDECPYRPDRCASCVRPPYPKHMDGILVQRLEPDLLFISAYTITDKEREAILWARLFDPRMYIEIRGETLFSHEIEPDVEPI